MKLAPTVTDLRGSGQTTSSAGAIRIKRIRPAAMPAMRTRRPLAINNGLCHGICNYDCRLCGVNKKSYCGPKEFQPREVTEKLITRVQEAARGGIHIRYIGNAGDGEPTLHPEFAERMNMFGDMKRNWDAEVPAPEVSVVTNGSRLTDPKVLKALANNPLTLIVSFPTSNPESYGTIMTGDASRGKAMLEKVVAGLDKVMALAARGKIDKLNFHISPPEREIVRRDFSETIAFLTDHARQVGLENVELVMFPSTSNRSGLIQNALKSMDMYKDLFRRYNGKEKNGVRVEMKLVLKRFFANSREIGDLIRAFDYPCIWNANLFVTPSGHSICCNDQAARNPFGDIFSDDLSGLMHNKESYVPNRVCKGCDSAPHCAKGSPLAIALNMASRIRMAWTRRRRKEADPESLPVPA